MAASTTSVVTIRRRITTPGERQAGDRRLHDGTHGYVRPRVVRLGRGPPEDGGADEADARRREGDVRRHGVGVEVVGVVRPRDGARGLTRAVALGAIVGADRRP